MLCAVAQNINHHGKTILMDISHIPSCFDENPVYLSCFQKTQILQKATAVNI